MQATPYIAPIRDVRCNKANRFSGGLPNKESSARAHQKPKATCDRRSTAAAGSAGTEGGVLVQRLLRLQFIR